MEILIENVRCFHGEHIIPVAPMTLLVGENSAGKSTFLAILAALSNPSGFPFSPSFNTAPYDLGSYENIATRRSAHGKPARHFRIGFFTHEPQQAGERTAIATYKGHLGQSVLSNFEVKHKKGAVSLSVEKDKVEGTIKTAGADSSNTKTIPFTANIHERGSIDSTGFLPLVVMDILHTAHAEKKNAMPPANELFEIILGAAPPFENVLSIAPIRTKPRRTYDQFNDEFKPEGDHVPLRLARVLESDEDHNLRERLQTGLKEFGEESGLFTEVEIQRLGKAPSSPFQVIIRAGGLSLNLLDVGYGVSQSLPIVVQAILSRKNGLLLMQQPEVHLHPRAQAALGSLFSKLTKTRRLRFTIETHSDFLVDRIRQEVARGVIGHEDVLILFFHKTNGCTAVHPIHLDATGNIVDPPDGYRDFFLEEELKLLSRGAGSCA